MTSQPTVLVVEDNAEMRAFLRKQLVDQYQVVVAEDGRSGWRQVQKAHPDLVVSDSRVQKGGHSLCKRVKSIEEAGIPVIQMGTSEEEEVSEADVVLPKPFSVETLQKRVDQCLPGRTLPDDRNRGMGAFLRELVDEVEQRLGNPDFSVQRLADVMSMSRRHLTRRVKDETDKTPAVLIRERRIERAKEHLISDPDTIAGVGKTVGFRSPSHFSQVFRRLEGCSPSTFMENHGES